MSLIADLTGKTALVTGAARGIGKATAELLMQNGARIVATATSPEKAEELSKHLNKLATTRILEPSVSGASGQTAAQNLETATQPLEHVVLPLNISQAADIERFFAELQQLNCLPDIVVNNAGITKDNLSLRMSLDDWQQVINTNLTGTFLVSKAALKHMLKQRWGRIINISSVVALTGNPGQANYTASKAGVLAFTKSLAREIASRGITVNAIAPGFIATDMTKNLTEQQQENILSQVPMAHMGKPEDIANAVLFLASNAAGYITGETLQISGGLFMK